MPGIVGFISRMPRHKAERELSRMLETLRHESFYVAGTLTNESLGVYVGWALRKISFSDGMPVYNEQGTLVLVFSGEEFPEPGTKQRLEGAGPPTGGKGPSYLVHLYEEDPSFPLLERKISGTGDGPHPRNGDALQRPLRDAPTLLSRVKGRLLFRCGSEGDPGGPP